MKRLFSALIIVLALLLLGATTLPLQLQPEQPRLGEPLVLTIQLPSGGWELSGYPDLRPFRLLGKAEVDGHQLRLKLLPLRPGPAALPALPLHKGSRSWTSPSRQIDIEDPYRAQQQPAGLRGWPEAGGRTTGWIIALLLLAATLSSGLLLTRKAVRTEANIEPAPLETLSRRLERLRPCAGKEQLRRQLDGWRFGPYPAENRDLAAWQEQLTALERQP